ncbi:unnamed protein product [Gongylonema pulchrum]|uniref:Uncharacterized protein n=1 Tax=Gongylonema pulchrum TaxID=637853 RepID=A0A183CVT3_9BILA|nr:unnamed protein product [Gongylonema pulchrum]
MLKVLTHESLTVPDEYVPTIFDLDGRLFTDSFFGSLSFKVYDTAGKSRYDRLRQLTCLDANVVIICYSINSRSSFWDAEYRVELICLNKFVKAESSELPIKQSQLSLKLLGYKNYLQWYDEIRFGFFPRATPFVLAATKIDLRTDESMKIILRDERDSMVSSIEGRNLSRRIGAFAYVECSAKNRVRANQTGKVPASS